MQKEKFLSEFDQNFAHLKGKPVVLYGIGEYTKVILDNKKDFCILGLMDVKTTGQVVYGVKVLSEEELVSGKAEAVIIAANLSVADIIYKRIEKSVRCRGIEVYYLNGCRPAFYDETIKENLYWKKNRMDLQSRINEYDVISFDIFDTVVMRRCWQPEDIFYTVEREICKEKGIAVHFAEERRQAEKVCYRTVTKYFNLNLIYEELGKKCGISRQEQEEIKEKELEAEQRYLTVRKEVAEAMRYARQAGKKVILTSDMYLGRKQIERLLHLSGIDEYDDIYISCDIRRDKYRGEIWDYLKIKYQSKKLLHIGDNEIADVKTPSAHGIGVYHIASARKLTEISGITAELESGKRTEGDQLLLGLFAERAMNSPFALSETKGKLKVSSMYDFGYLFYGPLVLNFLLWLVRESRKKQIDTLLFVSRDGYLLERLYRKIAEKEKLQTPEPVYFFSSRRATSVACIEKKEDVAFIIDKICETPAMGYDELLNRCFGISVRKDDSYKGRKLYEIGKEAAIHHIWAIYEDEILDHAGKERQAYKRYVDSLRIGKRAGFVNFVCRGVTQLFVSRLLNKRLEGFYFASEEDILEIYPDMEDIHALYGECLSSHTSKLHLMVKYLFGEVIFSAPHGQVLRFSKEGNPIFQEEKERRFDGIYECHCGIEGYLDDLFALEKYPEQLAFSNDFIDRIFGLFSSDYVLLSDAVKSNFTFYNFYGEDEKINLFD